MFPLQPRVELVFGSPKISKPDDLILQDHDHFMDSNTIISFSSSSTTNNNDDKFGFGQIPLRERNENNNDNNNRKVIHRDIERKRRREMSDLYASLRLLLPAEHVKGKRSTCDHMQEAVNYIKSKQNKIQELRIRRDELKKSSNNLSSTKVGSGSSGSDHSILSHDNVVTVNRVQDHTLEILIQKSEPGISGEMAQLLEREVNVVSCLSTRTKGMFLHVIRAQDPGTTTVDLSVLQERLAKAVR